MNYAVILAGGKGTRLCNTTPKQYISVNGKPIIAFCLEAFQHHSKVDKIIIVANDAWKSYILEIIEEYKITKYSGIAPAGESRQHSVFNGMKYIKDVFSPTKDVDIVMIHDAARPNVSAEIIENALDLGKYDAAVPVVPPSDTIYYSDDGKNISKLLDRDRLYAGQTPETFLLNKYYAVHENISDEELFSVRGSAQLAFRNGFLVKLYKGEHINYKITTEVDLRKFKLEQDINNTIG